MSSPKPSSVPEKKSDYSFDSSWKPSDKFEDKDKVGPKKTEASSDDLVCQEKWISIFRCCST